MNDKPTGLENFVERHRADFDAFEPRPDLWDAIAQELDAPQAEAPLETAETAAPLRIVKLYPDVAETTPTPAEPKRQAWAWNPKYNMVAALALLLMAGLAALWGTGTSSTPWTGTAPVVVVSPNADPMPANATESFGASVVGANSAASAAPTQRLATAVQRMEDYYATQIAEREAELKRLEAETGGAKVTADWQRELAALDSTYAQLKGELYRNPEPDVVLDAMNRNLQIRLDILNQQARTREQMQEFHAQSPAGTPPQKP